MPEQKLKTLKMPADPPRVVATMEGVIRGALLRRRGLMGSTEETIGN